MPKCPSTHSSLVSKRFCYGFFRLPFLGLGFHRCLIYPFHFLLLSSLASPLVKPGDGRVRPPWASQAVSKLSQVTARTRPAWGPPPIAPVVPKHYIHVQTPFRTPLPDPFVSFFFLFQPVRPHHQSPSHTFLPFRTASLPRYYLLDYLKVY